jgi:tellurite resistance protein
MMMEKEHVGSRLQHFAISFYAIVLGMVGVTLAFQRAEIVLHLPIQISIYLRYFTIVLSVFISVLYLAKLIRYPLEVKKEFAHPVKINFFPIVAKIFLIFSIIYLDLNMTVSKYLWVIGVVLQFAFTLIIISVWIQKSGIELHHLNPAWFIPIVGNIIIPIAGVRHFSAELSWFFFSIGIIMWMALFVIVLNRIIFHHPISDKLAPTLFILFAPPAIGFISYIKLTDALDPFAKILYYISVFLFILVVVQFKLFRKIKFYLSWWAYTFPTAAITLATLLMYHKTSLAIFKVGAYLFLMILSMFIIYLTYKTLKRIAKKEICIAEE